MTCASIHPSVRRSLFLSFHSRAFPGRLRASSACPRTYRHCSISTDVRSSIDYLCVKLCIIKHHTRATRTDATHRRATPRPDERRATLIESEGIHSVGASFRADTMTTKRATTEIRTTMKRIESTRAHCARVVEKLTASGESGDVAVARRAKVRGACVIYRCVSRRPHVDGGMCAHGMVWSTLG